MAKYWFAAKKVGFGIGPASWEGWAVVVVFVASLICIGFWPGLGGRDLIVARVGLIVALIVVIILKYQPPSGPT